MDGPKSNTEKPVSTPVESEKPLRQGGESKEVRQVVEGVSETLENAEVMETGEVSERTREDKKKAPSGGFGSRAAAAAIAAAKPLVFPKIEIMQHQIAKAVEREIEDLEREAARISRKPPAEFKPHELNGVVSKIRELKDILYNLAHVTFETLRSWWIKYVKKSV